MVLENVAKLMFFISLANNHATFFIIFFSVLKNFIKCETLGFNTQREDYL